jgi:nicotinate-nucleotide adenylyltransferase
VIVGIFGGSFNPPHIAHVLAATAVVSLHPLDRLVVVPTFMHPFAKSLAPFADRVAMCEIAMGALPNVEISRIEEELGGESKTLRTLERLAELHPDWKMRLVMGADLVVEAPKWHGFDKIEKLAPPLILGRVGITYPGCPHPILPSASSTEVRDLLVHGSTDRAREIVPHAVLDYIRAHGLYEKDEA